MEPRNGSPASDDLSPISLAPYEPRPLPAREPDAAELADLLRDAIAELPALPAEDPADRYGARPVTRAWFRHMKSHQTRRSYWRGLSLWLSYCGWHRVDPLNARLADVKDWIAGLGPTSPATYNARLAAVSAWYTELINNRVHDDNPARLVARNKRDHTESLTRALTYDELVALLGYVRARAGRLRSEAALRDRAILEIMSTTGVRSGAILHARIGPDGDLGIDQGHRILRYVNKGGHRKKADVLGQAELALDDYLSVRAEREQTPAAELSGWLFATGTGRPLTQRDLANLLHTAARGAGLDAPDDVVPHSLRHSVGFLAYEQGVALEDLSDLLGHESVATTLIYVRRTRRRQTTQMLADLTSGTTPPPAAPGTSRAPADKRHLRLVQDG
ncbi:tyrosine-type recombinase/integrase [Amycolatopsis sp.]|uniref:tyrosine-type recombinase/integrase n=1 Tax=Amycolatopsis sp. TaxID=37632 RepID=UPI002C840DE3|nr:tyrosine-type recombinase/integrase [Amycolatopsis sp.]HVV07725.1 tyrosine-type recombinase/integrase [Amycolatopsis sp.]